MDQATRARLPVERVEVFEEIGGRPLTWRVEAFDTDGGKAQPIRWIGRRSYDGRFVAGNRGVLPIRICAGELDDGSPTRDLWVSPGRAMLLHGVLVPAEYLQPDDVCQRC